MSIANIYEGWKNHLFPKEELKELINKVAKERIEICRTCPLHSSKHNTPLRFDEHCTHCGCTLSAKTKCLSCKCPIDKWDSVISEEQEEEINSEDGQNNI